MRQQLAGRAASWLPPFPSGKSPMAEGFHQKWEHLRRLDGLFLFIIVTQDDSARQSSKAAVQPFQVSRHVSHCGFLTVDKQRGLW